MTSSPLPLVKNSSATSFSFHYCYPCPWTLDKNVLPIARYNNNNNNSNNNNNNNTTIVKIQCIVYTRSESSVQNDFYSIFVFNIKLFEF